MLQIKVQIRNSNNDVYMWIDWHVGESAPEVLCRSVVEVQADCDELIEVIHSCVSLPCVTDPNHKHYQVQRWFGDHARWIAANIVGCR